MLLQTHWKTLTIAFVLPYLQLLGCSLVGLGIGAMSDASKPDSRSFSLDAIDSVEVGSDIILVKRDRSTVEGVYGGVRQHTIDRYIHVYNLRLAGSHYEGFLPGLDEPVVVRTYHDSKEGIFRGINRCYMLIEARQQPDTFKVHIDMVTAVEGMEGQSLDGIVLRELIQKGTLLSMSYVLLSTGHEQLVVPYEAVRTVKVKTSKHGAFIGFGIGALLDAVWIAALISCQRDEEEKPASSGSSGGTGCGGY